MMRSLNPHDAAMMDRLASEFQADDIHWFELRMQFAFLRGDLRKFRSLSETLVNQESHANEMENVANELALRGQMESLLGNYGVARKLCLHAEAMGKDSTAELWRCADAFGDAGDLPQAEALATKLDRMGPEDTIEQKVHLPVIRSIIERAGEETPSRPRMGSPKRSRTDKDSTFRIDARKLTCLQESTLRLPRSLRRLSTIADGAGGRCTHPWRNSVWHGPMPGWASRRKAAKPTGISLRYGKTPTPTFPS
jgi:hypothetical protein